MSEMLINVATLLKENIGSIRNYRVSDEIDICGNNSGNPFDAEVTLTRTDLGILVKGWAQSSVKMMCVRCLVNFEQRVNFSIEEEYFPSIDIATGTRLPVPDEDTALIIDDKHIMDLTEVIRQNALLTLPMKPVCSDNCSGLCPKCGKNLNSGACDCPKESIDTRWAELLKYSKK